MQVFRIALTKWASLNASGKQARWNPNGSFMIYTSSSLALACLENLVHRSGEGLSENFTSLLININEPVSISEVIEGDLPPKWTSLKYYEITQKIGRAWLESQASLILKVPSALISLESNYLINPQHPEFKNVSILQKMPFKFDSRFM